MDDPLMEGRFRLPGEDVGVYDDRDNALLHMPPKAQELEVRIQKICQFANSNGEGNEFLHPVIRSIILHFMIGYDHPFVDGNGRTARALFYWSMAKHGYWMMEYISISTVLKKAPAKYARSYLFTENDENDVTYFLDFNLRVIKQAIKDLQQYLARKVAEVKKVEKILGSSLFSKHLNHRQVALLSNALRKPNQIYTIESHKNSHDISYPTARSDLLSLLELSILSSQKIGKAFVFQPAKNIESKIEEIYSAS